MEPGRITGSRGNKSSPLISRWRELAVAAVSQAAKDIELKDRDTAAEAFRWLTEDTPSPVWGLAELDGGQRRRIAFAARGRAEERRRRAGEKEFVYHLLDFALEETELTSDEKKKIKKRALQAFSGAGVFLADAHQPAQTERSRGLPEDTGRLKWFPDKMKKNSRKGGAE